MALFIQCIQQLPWVGEDPVAGAVAWWHEAARALLEIYQDDMPIGRPDALVLGLMLGCGLRRSEVASLRWDDYDQASSSFTVMGARQRVVGERP